MLSSESTGLSSIPELSRTNSIKGLHSDWWNSWVWNSHKKWTCSTRLSRALFMIDPETDPFASGLNFCVILGCIVGAYTSTPAQRHDSHRCSATGFIHIHILTCIYTHSAHVKAPIIKADLVDAQAWEKWSFVLAIFGWNLIPTMKKNILIWMREHTNDTICDIIVDYHV